VSLHASGPAPQRQELTQRVLCNCQRPEWKKETRLKSTEIAPCRLWELLGVHSVFGGSVILVAERA
jgi:hypothetical protein